MFASEPIRNRCGHRYALNIDPISKAGISPRTTPVVSGASERSILPCLSDAEVGHDALAKSRLAFMAHRSSIGGPAHSAVTMRVLAMRPSSNRHRSTLRQGFSRTDGVGRLRRNGLG